MKHDTKTNKKKVRKKLFNLGFFKKKDKSINNDEMSQTSTGKKDKEPKDNKKKWKTFKVILFICIALFIVGTGIVLGVITGVIDKTDSIDEEDLKLLKLTTFVYDKNGNQIGALYDSENRVTVEYKNIPQIIVDSVTAIEDERFFSHHGVDAKRTFGAVFNYIIHAGKSDFGGSTITQQLVKNITSDNETSWTRKIREWYRAFVLETKLSKEEIFESYINTIYMGDGSYGFEVASNNYFGKGIKELNIAEAATLAAIIQSPESYNPYKGEEQKAKLLDRQKIVLNQLLKLKKITKEQYEEAKNYKIEFNKKELAEETAVQTYFVDAIIEQVIADLQDQKNVSYGIAKQMLYSAGYKIYTTQDPDIQSKIDDAYNNDKLFYTDKAGDFMQSAMVVMDQTTGNVLGLVGGAGEKTGSRVLNRATSLPRQPGSTMKPLGAYGPAFEMGVSYPAMGVDDCQLTIGDWTPSNYYDYFNGYVTAREAVAKSMNIPAVRTLQKVGVDYSYKFAKNLGLKNLVEQDKNLSSLALGGLTQGVTVLEMANAYATIANGGIYMTPKLYTKVLDKDGKEILTQDTSAKRVMKDSTAYMLTDVLKGVVNTGGTAAGYVKAGNMPIAGKTGNTNDDYDQWFVGFTPYYTVACWNGYDKSKAIGRGYPYTAVKLFNTVVNSISKGQTVKQFEKPSSIVTASVCKVSGLVPTDACRKDPRGDQTITDIFASGTVPTATCNIHKLVKIDADSGLLATDDTPNVVERSFITRDYVPKVKPRDWSYMLPTAYSETKKQNNQNTNNDGSVKIY